jgi:hypothetical protein
MRVRVLIHRQRRTACRDGCVPAAGPARWRGVRVGGLVALLLVTGACGRVAEPAPVAVDALTVPQRADRVEEPAAPASMVAAEPPPIPIELPPPQAAACLGRASAAGATSVAVHRWVDAAGITHYADRPPVGAARDHRVIAVSGLPPIRVEASGHDVNLPDGLQQQAVADALGVQRVLRDELGVAVPAGLVLRILFVADQAAYARLIGEPALAGSAGAYSTARQTIYIRLQPSDEANFSILRHELTHAIVHEAIGNLPLPLNEGLAEYFGRFRVVGMGGQVDFRPDRAALIAAAPAGDGSEALVDLLARDGPAFYAGDPGSTREQRYRRAHALVALLMQHGEGRAVLAELLAAQRADPCVPIVLEELLDARYGGGLRRLAADWAAFMRKPPTGTSRY